MNPKDIVVSYKGGGYSGCIFEWNYFLFDSDGKFHDIGSSGSRGIDNEADALALLEEFKGWKPSFGDSNPDVFITDLNDHDSILTFSRDTNEGHVIAVTKKVNEVYGEPKMWFECDICKEHVFDGIPEGLRGCGGITMCHSKKICEDCYSSHTCGYCGEFSEDIADLAMGKDKDRCTACVEE